MILTTCETTDIEKDSSIEFENKLLGKCPYCGKNVILGPYGMYCEDNVNDSKCKFIVSYDENYVSKHRNGKALTESEMKKLLMPSGLTLKIKSSAGNTYCKVFHVSPTYSEQYKGVQFDSQIEEVN